MALTRRCFSSAQGLRHLCPQVLRDTLALFPELFSLLDMKLPAIATSENLDYQTICTALISSNVDEDLDNLLHLACLLGTGTGWSMIERQAKIVGCPLPPPDHRHGYIDLALLTAITDWPRHKDILIQVNAQMRVHARSSYDYFAPTRDHRAAYRTPTEGGLTLARASLTQHFANEGLASNRQQSKATEIIPYDFENEIWFMIRYPGKRIRHSGCNTDGDWKAFVYNPEQYDAVVYNKVYADLRMNTRRKRERAKYRIAFSNLLFQHDHAFHENVTVVNLNPLLDKRATELFDCDDIPGLESIAPVELCYELFGLESRMRTDKASEGRTLLDGNEFRPGLTPLGMTISVRNAVLEYRLKDSRRNGKLRLRRGNCVSYERDGDSLVLESWLRRRGFVRSFI